jgi:hypothetical protein
MKASESKKIEYKSELHRKTLPRLQDRCLRGEASISDRLPQWEANEEQYLAYMPARVVDSLRDSARDAGEPQYTTIEIPFSYAILLTAHTYITSTLLARSPVQQVTGRHGEAQQCEAAIEALLDYQLNVGCHLVPMYVWTLDALKYGIGIMGYYWDEEQVKTTKIQRGPKTWLGIEIPGAMETKTIEETTIGYQGTRAYNVRPQDFLTDPAYPANQFQKGDFCARYVEIPWLDIVDDSGVDGCYFNVDALRESRRSYAPFSRKRSSSQVSLPGDNQISFARDLNEDEGGVVHGYEIFVRLIPADWGLGSGKKSEKWVFVLAEDDVIIKAQPLGYYHDRYPFEIVEQEIDGHAAFARSMLETTKPLNDTLTWLVNTHFYNVRKSLNDQFIVDPSRVVMKDLTDPNPGRLIRLKPGAYGTDIRAAVMQLPVQDITRANLTDAQLVQDMIQRVTGVNDSLMGMVNSGRKTATEVRSSTTFGINRLKTVTEYMSALGMGPWTQQIIQVTQQLYDQERKYKIVGDLAQFGDKYMTVTPEQIAGFYDYTPVDGTLPVDRFAQVNLWQTLMGQAAKVPQIMAQYDFAKIFAFVAQLAGLKNINQFKIQVVPDAAMQNQAQAGNSVPMAPPSDGTGMPPPNMANTGGSPPQIAGMGQTL